MKPAPAIPHGSLIGALGARASSVRVAGRDRVRIEIDGFRVNDFILDLDPDVALDLSGQLATAARGSTSFLRAPRWLSRVTGWRSRRLHDEVGP